MHFKQVAIFNHYFLTYKSHTHHPHLVCVLSFSHEWMIKGIWLMAMSHLIFIHQLIMRTDNSLIVPTHEKLASYCVWEFISILS